MTLYAHMKGFKKGIRQGKYVKQGTVIGYLGSTGLSTGPHLHFGLYKNGRAINPASVVQVTTTKLQGKARQTFMAEKEKMDTLLETVLSHPSVPDGHAQVIDNACYIDPESCLPLKKGEGNETL